MPTYLTLTCPWCRQEYQRPRGYETRYRSRERWLMVLFFTGVIVGAAFLAGLVYLLGWLEEERLNREEARP